MCCRRGDRLPPQCHPSCLLWLEGPGSALGSASRGHRDDGVTWLVLVSFPCFGQGSKLKAEVRRKMVVPSDGGPGKADLAPEVPQLMVAMSSLDQGLLV